MVPIHDYCAACQGPHPLTNHQDKVLGLLAEGWSNRSIGTRITPKAGRKTIEYHCTHIYAGLDIGKNDALSPRVAAILWWQRHQTRMIQAQAMLRKMAPISKGLPFFKEIDMALGEEPAAPSP